MLCYQLQWATSCVRAVNSSESGSERPECADHLFCFCFSLSSPLVFLCCFSRDHTFTPYRNKHAACLRLFQPDGKQPPQTSCFRLPKGCATRHTFCVRRETSERVYHVDGCGRDYQDDRVARATPPEQAARSRKADGWPRKMRENGGDNVIALAVRTPARQI